MKYLVLLFTVVLFKTSSGQLKHSTQTLYPSYKGLVMAGYQGWFRAAGDGSGASHFAYGDEKRSGIDMWPDVTEYEKTYPTPWKLKNGEPARFFSSTDKSTIDLHFKWMQQYGVDGVFMQRFFGNARQPDKAALSVIRNAFQA